MVSDAEHTFNFDAKKIASLGLLAQSIWEEGVAKKKRRMILAFDKIKSEYNTDMENAMEDDRQEGTYVLWCFSIVLRMLWIYRLNDMHLIT